MDFLETDFHRRKNPKRSIRLRSADNLLVGVNLARYPIFVQAAWKVILSGFSKDTLSVIRKGDYRTAFPATLLQLIKLEVDKVTDQQMDELRSAVGGDIVQLSRANRTDYEKALTVTIEAAAGRIRARILSPFMSHIRQPLERLDLGDESTVTAIEEELCELLIEPARNKISELVRKLITDTPVELGEELRSSFKADTVRPLVMDFFSNFGVGDLFLELYELERNKSILDKQEFYLYFCDIAYEGSKYPIFYIPFSTAVREHRLVVEFDAQVYLNKRALEYVVQQENERTGKKGTLRCTADRIVYLAKEEARFPQFVSAVLAELGNFFQLDKSLDIEDTTPRVAKSAAVRITNACYIALFDNSDEALLNDYEQILQLLGAGSDTPVAQAFKGLIDDFIHRNPDSVAGEVEDEWDALGVPDRLVCESPIALNSEQRQILMALLKDRCKYITVEGPPGTGKSHTITAIICNTVLNNQSVLVLSDKKEALDVVEDKIISTLNRVRNDKKFQNPILRLGGTGSTYAQILSGAVMAEIKAHYRAVRKQHEAIRQTITGSCAALKEDIEAEALSYGDIALSNIKEWAALETSLVGEGQPVYFREVLAREDSVSDLEDLYSISKAVQELGGLEPPQSSIAAALGSNGVDSVDTVSRFFKAALSLEEMLVRAENTYQGAANDLRLVRSLSVTDGDRLSAFIQRYADLRKPLIGYLFSRRAIDALDQEFRVAFAFGSPDAPHVRLADIERIRNIAQFLKGEMERLPTPLHGDGLTLCHALLTDPDLRSFLRRLADSAQGAGRLRETLTKYPATLERLGIAADLRGFSASRLAKMAESEFALLVRYVSLAQELRQTFRQIPEVNYAAEQERVQDLVTVYMTYLMDGRVIEFYDNQKNIARSLRDIIRSKQRFPQTEFRTLKDAFPCILAGIRDYAEYIPFEPEIFDLLIIDEASQVSIAQAFPALLRARKILILGDKKQFSNVKAGQARGDTNREYMNRLEATFRQHVSRDPAKVVKLARFDIRTSILEFFEYISNYQARLLKHFRSYKELISYSNAKFYRNLQVMKIRGKSIDDVIQFTILPPSPGGPAPKNRNTNQQEAQFIISELLKLKEEGSKASVGIITPHTDQQKLLVDAVGRLPERDFLYSEFRLKIMTFDTCQGEERDLVFYSMVATGSSDKLWGVFIKDLASVDLEEDGKLKAQRLNVGFSRARECVHFVLSKPLDGYSGAIGEALRHFWSVRDEAKKEHAAAEVDPRSAREAAVLTWFYQTRFWNEEKDRIEFTPQFKLGKYLKQFDSYYSHPEYRVDFLLLYRPAASAERKIIIEYDGFREHFGEGIGIDAANYADYYSEEDVYRQKLLESYGYKFLRINRFNLGDDPIATLDGRLRRLLGKQPDLPHNDVLETIHSDIRQLQEGGLKECPKCKELRTTEEFKDASLASGVGRFCRSCKGVKRVRPARVSPSPTLTSPGPNPCPKCGSRMVLRTGRFGKFYGCSKYPYCRAIRPFAASTAGRTG
jgi:very-short-patch-repair endonuclease